MILDLLKEIDNMADKYMEAVRDLTPVKKTEKLKEIEESFAKAKELSDDKVQLAMQTYEMVNKKKDIMKKMTVYLNNKSREYVIKLFWLLGG